MRKQRLLHQSVSILTALILVFAFSSSWPATALADSGKDYVIVIDISTSMQDIFDDVKKLSKRTIARASVGDNVAVVTFGKRATLLDRKQIRGKADLESLQRHVDELYPTDYATYINKGLEKGLTELRYLFEKNPDRERVLLWLSDDKDNPPDLLGAEFITLDKLKKENTDFNPGSEWFDYDAPVSEIKNTGVEDFVMWARRTTYRVEVKERNLDLGSFEDTPVKRSISLTFEPLSSGAAGLDFVLSAYLVDRQDKAKRIPVLITPHRVKASGNTWKQKFQLEFDADPAEYKGTILFEPIAGGALEILPRGINFKTAIAPPEPEEVEKPAVEEVRPRGLLADAKEKGIIATEDRPPGLTRIEKPIAFGPLEPGKKDKQIITLFLQQEADPDGITLDHSIKLPEGVRIESKVFGKGKKLAAEITVSVDRNIQLPETFSLDRAYEGSIRFKSNEPGVQIFPLVIPVRINFTPDRMRWGRKMLAQPKVGQVKARRMTFEELTAEMEREKKEEKKKKSAAAGAVSTGTLSGPTARYALLAGLVVIGAIIGALLYRMRPASQVFVGELVVIKDPTDSNMKNINLKRIGSLHDKNVLTLGSSPKADIRLAHDSIETMHCRISAKTKDQQTEISILPIKGSPVKINEIEQSEKTLLSDKDLISIGDFILLFSNPEAQREVIARFQDGRTMRGTPVTWDIGTTSFELLRADAASGGGDTEEIAVVSFADLKAIFFLEDPSGSVAGMPGEMVNREELIEVTFSDGEKVEGYPLKDYSDVSGRFYIVPFEMPNVSSVLIERASVEAIERRKAPSEAESAKPGGLFASLRKRKGAAPAE